MIIVESYIYCWCQISPSDRCHIIMNTPVIETLLIKYYILKISVTFLVKINTYKIGLIFFHGSVIVNYLDF